MTEEKISGQEIPELEENQPDEKNNDNFKWFVVHSFSGYEKRVKRFLDIQLSRKYPDKVGEVLIPTQEVSNTRRGSKSTRQKKLYPGYVFVQLELNPEMIMDIRAMSNVSGFPPMNQGYPQPLSEEEISRLKGQAEGSDRARVVRVPYSVGQTVRVTEGPFNNFTGVVESINPERGRVRVIFTIFGRKAPVEIDFSQVRPV